MAILLVTYPEGTSTTTVFLTTPTPTSLPPTTTAFLSTPTPKLLFSTHLMAHSNISLVLSYPLSLRAKHNSNPLPPRVKHNSCPSIPGAYPSVHANLVSSLPTIQQLLSSRRTQMTNRVHPGHHLYGQGTRHPRHLSKRNSTTLLRILQKKLLRMRRLTMGPFLGAQVRSHTTQTTSWPVAMTLMTTRPATLTANLPAAMRNLKSVSMASKLSTLTLTIMYRAGKH